MLTVQLYLIDWEVYVPPSDATNTGCTVRDALYAIGYPGPVVNHLAITHQDFSFFGQFFIEIALSFVENTVLFYRIK